MIDTFALVKGKKKNGARARATLLEDLFEAFNGALFLDQGRGAVVKFIEQVVFPKIEAGEFSDQTDYKTNLQEFLQQDGEVEIEYKLLAEVGPSHARQFEVDVMMGDRVLGSGVGRNKKSSRTSSC